MSGFSIKRLWLILLVGILACAGSKPQPLVPEDGDDGLPLALMVLIDKSGSMRQDDKLKTAAFGALRAVDLLADRDLVGIIAFDSLPIEFLQVSPAGYVRPMLEEHLDGLVTFGLSSPAVAIRHAAKILAELSADRKHAIMLTDGRISGSSADFEAAAQALADAGVTFSPILIGVGGSIGKLRQLGRLSGSSFYHVAAGDRAALTAVLERDLARVKAQPPTGSTPVVKSSGKFSRMVMLSVKDLASARRIAALVKEHLPARLAGRGVEASPAEFQLLAVSAVTKEEALPGHLGADLEAFVRCQIESPERLLWAEAALAECRELIRELQNLSR